MAKAVWTGTISFGLVSIPVRLYNATSPKDVRFHQFDGGSGRRIRYRRVADPAEATWPAIGDDPVSWSRRETFAPTADDGPATGPDAPPSRPTPDQAVVERDVEVPYERVIKGFEVERDRHVLLTRDEIEALEPERTRTIEIEGFVDLADVDPVYFEKSYYVAPQRGRGAEKPYALLLESLRRSNRAGVARFVMRSREYLCAIRPLGDAICLETLFFADEVRALSEVDNLPGRVDLDEGELRIASQLIDLLSTSWDPARYRDTFRERVLELIASKTPVETVEREPAAPAASRVSDLMAALEASVKAAREAEGAARPAKRARRRTG